MHLTLHISLMKHLTCLLYAIICYEHLFYPRHLASSCQANFCSFSTFILYTEYTFRNCCLLPSLVRMIYSFGDLGDLLTGIPTSKLSMLFILTFDCTSISFLCRCISCCMTVILSGYTEAIYRMHLYKRHFTCQCGHSFEVTLLFKLFVGVTALDDGYSFNHYWIRQDDFVCAGCDCYRDVAHILSRRPSCNKGNTFPCSTFPMC